MAVVAFFNVCQDAFIPFPNVINGFLLSLIPVLLKFVPVDDFDHVLLFLHIQGVADSDTNVLWSLARSSRVFSHWTSLAFALIERSGVMFPQTPAPIQVCDAGSFFRTRFRQSIRLTKFWPFAVACPYPYCACRALKSPPVDTGCVPATVVASWKKPLKLCVSPALNGG